MASRAAHYRAKAKHAQREFGEAKKTLQPRGTDTMWVSEFLSSAQGTGPFNANSLITLPLGATEDERVLKLRQASAMGVLRMYAHRVNGVFVEYRWELTREGTW